MALPGTNAIVSQDTTIHQIIEYWRLTTQPGGVLLRSTLGRINHVQATILTRVMEPAAVSVVLDENKISAMVYATTDVPLEVDVMFVGDR